MQNYHYVGHIGFEPMTSALSRQRSKPTELMTLLTPAKGKTYFEYAKPKNSAYSVLNLSINHISIHTAQYLLKMTKDMINSW